MQWLGAVHVIHLFYFIFSETAAVVEKIIVSVEVASLNCFFPPSYHIFPKLKLQKERAFEKFCVSSGDHLSSCLVAMCFRAAFIHLANGIANTTHMHTHSHLSVTDVLSL